MASPSLDLLCCLFREGSNSSNANVSDHKREDMSMIILGFVFFTTLFLSALISIIGTIITLVPKRGVQRTRRDAVSDDRQRIILSWLAGSDLLACVGKKSSYIFFFSLGLKILQKFPKSENMMLLCPISTEVSCLGLY